MVLKKSGILLSKICVKFVIISLFRQGWPILRRLFISVVIICPNESSDMNKKEFKR